jgi:hypothetical protein
MIKTDKFHSNWQVFNPCHQTYIFTHSKNETYIYTIQISLKIIIANLTKIFYFLTESYLNFYTSTLIDWLCHLSVSKSRLSQERTNCFKNL